jgi:hypothetical protein
VVRIRWGHGEGVGEMLAVGEAEAGVTLGVCSAFELQAPRAMTINTATAAPISLTIECLFISCSFIAA